MDRPVEQVIVVGAGPAGAMAAALLAEDGYRVSVVDKRPDPREKDTQSGRSINLTLAERGLRALKSIGAESKALERSVPLYGRVIHTRDGERTYVPYGDNHEAIHSISRHELNVLVVEAAQSMGASFEFGTSCFAVDLEAPAITVSKGGSAPEERSADVVVAADGAYSFIRDRMMRLRYFDYSQRYAHLEYTEFVIEPSKDSSWGDRRNAVHVWPRGHYMLIGFPNMDGSLTLSLQLPRKGKVSHAALQTMDDLDAFFRAEFSDVYEDAAPMLEEYFDRPLGTMVTMRSSPWSLDGRVLLLGDACHAIFPSYGQGCNSSFQDCLALREALRRHGPGGWAAAIEEYEAERKPEANAIADLSIQHFEILNRELANPEHALEDEIWRELRARDSSFASLYHNVSFTALPYTQAIEQERAQSRTVRQIAEAMNEGESMPNAIELVLGKLTTGGAG